MNLDFWIPLSIVLFGLSFYFGLAYFGYRLWDLDKEGYNFFPCEKKRRTRK